MLQGADGNEKSEVVDVEMMGDGDGDGDGESQERDDMMQAQQGRLPPSR